MALAIVPLAAAAVAAPAPAPLERRLDAALAAASLRGARVSALVVDARDGRELYAREADRALTPASNVKLLTALAALSAFGPSHRFRTALLADRPLGAEGEVGRLFVVGGGDPALTSEQWWRLAADLRALGLRSVGEIVLDDGLFERARWHPSWGAVSSRAYHAPISALSANYGAFTVWVEPGGRAGDPVSVRVDPPVPWLDAVNRARTGPRRSPARLTVEREPSPEGERVVVSGTLPAGAPAQAVARSVSDPTGYAGAVLRMQLAAVGIEVRSGVRAGPAPREAVPIHEFLGMSLGEILVPFLKWSNNAIGETLLKDLALRAGAPEGSWLAGARALRAELALLGVGSGAVELFDGSGLSYHNRASARTFVEALRVARDRFGIGPELAAALPIAGSDGTLRRRADAARGRVRAKTGLLTQIAGLSGYAEAPGGEVRVFSVLVNGFRGDARAAMDALDAFAAALASTP